MRTPRLAVRAALAIVASALLASRAAPVRAAEPDYESLLLERAPAIVTVKYVLKSNDWESPSSVLGALIDADGLVVTSGWALGGGDSHATAMKVLIGNDPKENEAIVVARDSVLGLAYLRMLATPDGKPLTFVDLEKGVEPRIGQSLFGISRHGSGFDYAPSLQRLYLTSRVETPRAMWNFAGDFTVDGLPVFDLEGRPAGVIAHQSGSEGADEHGSDTFVLPLKDVRKSIAQAKKRVPEALAKAKEAKEAAKDEASPSPAPAKDGAKPPEPSPAPAPAPKGPDAPGR
jgi:hypothetical protein